MSTTNQNEEDSLPEFIKKLENLNIKLRLDGGTLRCKAPKGAVTGEIRQRLEERKKDIISFLHEKEDEEIFYEPIPSVKDSEYYPLSAAQKRMYILNQIDRESTAYNLTQVLKIEGAFDKKLFLDVFKRIAQRHESLRTYFKVIDGEPVQIIRKEIDINADYTETEGTEDQIDGIVNEFIRPYDLESCPLFRLKFIKMIRPGEKPVFYVIVDMHHIISDGISVSILVNEINALYAKKELPALKNNYRDYVAWNERIMSGGIVKKQRDYWRKQFEGEIPVLNLPTDYQRPENFSFEGDSVKLLINKDLSQKLNNLARENRVTLFSVLLCAYYILLYKYTGQNDIVIGTATAGRRHADINDIIGVFMNSIALRNHPDSEKTFAGFLREVGENSLAAFDNQDYPFEKLVEDLNIKRDPSRNPIFNVMFILLNINISEMRAEGTRISYYDYKKKMSQFDILINATECEKGIIIELNYCTSLFKRETAERLGSHFVNILGSAAENPSVKLGHIAMFSSDEKERLIKEYNNTYLDYPRDKLVHQLFEEQAEKNKDAVALVFKDKQLTYGELNRKADALARTLAEKGVKKDDIVGLMVERSFNMIIGMLGILKAGGAYLPIDPGFPADRISYMLQNSGTRILLSQPKFYERLAGGENNAGCEFIDIDDECAFDYNGKGKAVASDSHRLAYVIYTSGSTGKPKGVMLEHRSVVNFIKGVTDRIAFNAGNTILCLTTISFDIFVLETLLPLSAGMKIVIADENQQKDSRLLNDVIEANGVDMLQITPSRLQLLIHGVSSLTCLKKLKTIMVGGEAFPQNLLSEIKNLTEAKIYNMYGPTETTVWSTVGELTGVSSVDIGTPIANTKIYILDKDGNPVPQGVSGELCIGGDGLARGYLNKPELTAEKFLSDPFYESGKMYKTGDLARRRSDGKIECLGRIDQQVKIRGFRIELEEIEKRLSDFKAIKECVVVAKTDETGGRYLAAYYSASEEILVTDIRNYLSKDLPDYMVPEIFVYIDKLPYTPNGKIDRKALPEPGSSRPKLGTAYKDADSQSEKVLSEIWQNVLKRELVGVDDNFFELGGNSLTLIKMHGEVEKAYPGKVSVTDIFAHPTISKLSQMIDGRGSVGGNKEKPAQMPVKSKSAGDSRDIAIIGMAGRFGSAKNIREFWEGLRAGKDFVRELPKQRKEDCGIYINTLINAGLKKGSAGYFDAAFMDRIDGFDCGFFNISPREAELMDPHQRFFLETAWEAIEDAGYGGKRLTGSKTGVFVGYSSDLGVEYKYYATTISTLNDQIAISGNVKSIMASRISYILDLKGPSVIIDTACSSSLVALHAACRSLQNGECGTALVGGCKISIVPENENPESGGLGLGSTNSRSNTFDESADGMGYGEGGGAVLLKPLGRAQEDGDNIYAVIKGSAVNQDGASVGITAPNMAAQEEVMVSAWEDAGIDPETVSYIETHGTGTKLGDPIEIAGITKAFERYTQKKQFCAVASVKTNVGHLDNASGIASLIKAVLCLKNRELPPSLHFKNPNRKIQFENSPVYVIDKLCKWENNGLPRRCGISSFGLSGTNCHVVLEEYDCEKTRAKQARIDSGKLNVITFSAKNETSLKALTQRYGEYLSCNNSASLGDICYTANTGRGHYNMRLAVAAGSLDDLKNKISFLNEKGFENSGDGIFFGKTKLVSSAKRQRQPCEVTLEEIRDLNLSADSLLDSILAENDNAEYNKLLSELCETYIKGADIEWGKLYSTSKHFKASIPAYPFLEERHWIKPDKKSEYIADKNTGRPLQSGETVLNQIELMGRDTGFYSETEKLLGSIWGEALGLDKISIYDDFFDIGGNSLVAIKVEAYAEKYHLDFGSPDLYEYRTIEQLAIHLAKDKTAGAKVIVSGKPAEKEISASGGDSKKRSGIQLIENIEPFNDVFYRSCYFNSFFPVANHFGKGILPYLVNDIAVFTAGADGNGVDLGIEYISSLPMDQLFEEEGLSVKTRNFSEGILSDIKTSLAEKKPVVVWVDCFYESIRTDLYQKQHWPHTILIYGFDEAEKKFYVIEHSYRDNLSYEKRVISFSDMYNMSRGYVQNLYRQMGQPSLNIFSLSEDSGKGDRQEDYYIQFYKQNILDKKDLINGGFEHLRLFIPKFEKISSDSETFFANGENLIAAFNAVINAKEAHRYKINNLFGRRCADVSSALDELIEKWAAVRRVTAKSLYANVYDSKKMHDVSDDLKAVYQMELEYYKLLLSSFSAF